MKKFSKILLAAALAAIVGTGSAFAKGKDGMGKEDMGFGRGMKGHVEVTADGTVKPAPDYIGQVTAVDEKNGTIKVADMDGKETVINVNTFTYVQCSDSKDAKTISDIKKGDWIMYSFYNTETEKKLARQIYVKK